MWRDGPALIRLRAHVAWGESLVVQESYDPAWRAYSGDRSVPIARDVAGFMRLDPSPGDREVTLVFEQPFESLAGRALTAISVAIAAAMALRRRS